MNAFRNFYFEKWAWVRDFPWLRGSVHLQGPHKLEKKKKKQLPLHTLERRHRGVKTK